MQGDTNKRQRNQNADYQLTIVFAHFNCWHQNNTWCVHCHQFNIKAILLCCRPVQRANIICGCVCICCMWYLWSAFATAHYKHICTTHTTTLTSSAVSVQTSGIVFFPSSFAMWNAVRLRRSESPSHSGYCVENRRAQQIAIIESRWCNINNIRWTHARRTRRYHHTHTKSMHGPSTAELLHPLEN